MYNIERKEKNIMSYNLLIKLDTENDRNELLDFLDKDIFNMLQDLIKKDNVFFHDDKTKKETLII